MTISSTVKRTGIAAMLACSVLLAGCYDGRPGHNSDRHHERHDRDHDRDHGHHD